MNYIVAAFFFIGLADYTFGNKLKLGEHFYKGISILPTLVLSMVGIYSLSPLLGQLIGLAFAPLSRVTGVDISLFPNIFLAMDLGGYAIAQDIATSPAIADFSGILVGSSLGATLSFALPVALGMLKKEDTSFFMQGFIFGMIVMPFGAFLGGLVQGLPFSVLWTLSLPLLLVSVVIIILFSINANLVIGFFRIFQKILTGLGAIGLLLQGIYSITGHQLVPALVPLEDAFLLIGRVALFLGGVYPLTELIKRVVLKRLTPLSEKVGLQEVTLIGILVNMVNNLIIFDDFHNMKDKDKLFISVLAITSPYCLGGQLAYVASEAAHMTLPFMVSKIAAGVLGILLLLLFQKIGKKRTPQRPRQQGSMKQNKSLEPFGSRLLFLPYFRFEAFNYEFLGRSSWKTNTQ